MDDVFTVGSFPTLNYGAENHLAFSCPSWGMAAVCGGTFFFFFLIDV